MFKSIAHKKNLKYFSQFFFKLNYTRNEVIFHFPKVFLFVLNPFHKYNKTYMTYIMSVVENIRVFLLSQT